MEETKGKHDAMDEARCPGPINAAELFPDRETRSR